MPDLQLQCLTACSTVMNSQFMLNILYFSSNLLFRSALSESWRILYRLDKQPSNSEENFYSVAVCNRRGLLCVECMLSN